MISSAILRRLPVVGTLGLLIGLAAFLAPSAFTADTTLPTLVLRPHCAAGVTPCPEFAVADAETLQTPPLNKGDSLHMDLVAKNPAMRKISRVRAWLQYNPTVLGGSGVTIGEALPTPTPGELTFSGNDGLVKIDASAQADQEPATEEILVARLLFKVKTVPQTNTDVLSFYDVQQTTGHTRIVAKKDNGESEDILTQIPGSLLITFVAQQSSSASSDALSAASTSSVASSAASSQADSDSSQDAAGSGSVSSELSSTLSSDASGAAVPSSAASSSIAPAAPICGNGLLETGEGCDDGNFLAGDGCSVNCTIETNSSSSTAASSVSSTDTMQPDGTICGSHSTCLSGLCSGGVCRGDVLKVEDGGACNAPTQCLSGACSQNRCGSPASSSAGSLPGDTAFAQLQVRSVRITTEGTSIYVAWDPLVSSQLKGYNLYYGTTSGRYIQRKTISAESTSMAIRGLPEKTTYFVAIRALNLSDEESAFSQEVAVEIGNPKTSTAPLSGDLLKTKNPVTVPGETGVSSVFALVLILSAVTGTALASRRQIVALAAPPHAR